MESDRVAVELLASVTVTTKLNVPVAPGEPLNAPPAESTTLGGNVPDDTLKLYGARPPLAASVGVYGELAYASGSEAVVICSGAAIDIVIARLASFPLASETLAVKLNAPDAVGVPETRPVAALSVRPAGSAPVVMLHASGDLP